MGWGEWICCSCPGPHSGNPDPAPWVPARTADRDQPVILMVLSKRPLRVQESDVKCSLGADSEINCQQTAWHKAKVDQYLQEKKK